MKEYKSKLAQLVQSAVDDCITYGSGSAKNEADKINDGVEVQADWGENEEDIEVTVMQFGAVLFTFIERDVMRELEGAE